MGFFAAVAMTQTSLAQFTTATVWSDEFNYSGSPDPGKWGYDIGGGGWGNNELQHYTARPENARVENGSLVINARQENYGGNSYTSARMRSQGQGDWTYGRVEVRARFTGAAGTWPAIWMLPTDWVYGPWPDSGEIDLMEHVSTHGESVQASIHTLDYNFQINTAKVGFQYNVDYWNWHNYIIEWYPDRLDISIDGIRYFTFRNEGLGYRKWPFDQRFHLMLNIAVGGWGGNPSFTSETMEIDHVRFNSYSATSQVPVASDQWFRLVNRQSGKVLDVAGPSNDDGANIHQWSWVNGESQQWRLEADDIGAYKVFNRASGALPDVAGGSWDNGANVQQWSDVGTPQQRWLLQPVGDGFYKLVNRETGRVMEAIYDDNTDGGNVQQWDYVGGTNQQWRVEPLVAANPAVPTGLAGKAGDETTTLTWNAVPGVSGYRVKRATTIGGPYIALGGDVVETRFEDLSRESGVRHYYVVVGCVASEESAASAEIEVDPSNLPPGWERRDIGAVDTAGTANFVDGRFEVEGAGADIWGTADEFRLASVEMNGDGEVIARLDALADTDPWAKAGVMLRESAEAGSKYAMMALTSGNGATFQSRGTTGGETQATATPRVSAPRWLKLVRSGDTITGYHSANGTQWTPAGNATVAMSSRVLAGLAVTSHADPTLAAAIFSKVSVLPPAWAGEDVGVPALGGASSVSANGEWMVAGGGADIAGTSDQFHFVSQSFAGDGSLTANVTSVEASDPYSKAGVMFRESSNADSPYAYAFAGPSTLGFECRTAAGVTTTGVAYVGGTAPISVLLVRSGNDFSALVSTDGTVWIPLGDVQTIAMAPGVRAGLAVTSHQVAALSESTFSSVSLLPAKWTAADIGGPGIPGGTVLAADAGSWTVNGSGGDIWGNADAFQFAHRALIGDGSIVARVISQQDTDPWAKAGVMIRSTTGAGSLHAFMALTPGNGAAFLSRAATGGVTTSVSAGGGAAPHWVKLVRSGNLFTGYGSTNGTTWTEVGNASVALSQDVLVGLAVSSHDDSVLNASTFDNVFVTPKAPASVTATAGDGSVALTWSAVGDATSYQLKRATVSGGPYLEIANPSVPRYTDSAVTNGIRYYYAVAAVNPAAASANSPQASALPINPEVAWQQAEFDANWNNHTIAGETADPDRDGLINLIERGLKGNPNASDPIALTRPGVSDRRFAINFARDTGNTDLLIVVQAADNLSGPWTDLASSANGATTVPLLGGVGISETGSGSTRNVEVRDLHMLGTLARPHRFMRIEITGP